MPPWPRTTRSRALRRLAALAALIATALGAGAPAASAALDYSTRAAFDALDRAYRGGHGDSMRDNDQGALAWGESYFLQSYILMYERYGDRFYLEKFIRHTDRVLDKRDSVRGVTDWLGRSLPAWRTTNPYTVGAVTLTDPAGAPVLELRTALPVASRTRVTVRPGTLPGTFRLDLLNNARANRVNPCGPERPAPAATHDNLTMRRGEPTYAVDAINAAFGQTPMLLTAREARADPAAAALPVPGVFTFRSLPFVFPVHTGQITYPLARFARLVRETPALRAVRRYRDAAARYLQAARQAVAVHDADWRQGPDGEGWYAFPRGAPVRFDGAEAPLNQSLAMGRVLYELALITRCPEYRQKVAALALTLRRDMAPDPRGSYVWTYAGRRSALYRGWGLADRPGDHTLVQPPFTNAEDAGHGWIGVAFAVDTLRRPVAPPAFTDADMAALAATFTRNLATTGPAGLPGVWDRVDGTGCAGVYDNIAAAWTPLAAWDRAVYDHALARVVAGQGVVVDGAVFGCANLNRHAPGAAAREGSGGAAAGIRGRDAVHRQEAA